MIQTFPEWLQIFLFSIIPVIEYRYVVPLYAINECGWIWWHAFPIAILGNIILVPFILLFFQRAERYLRKFPKWKNAMDWGFPLVRKRADSKIRKYETASLIIFVAIPLPFTGAGLGSLIAYLFDLPIKKSFLMILLGVLISTTTTTILYFSGKLLFM